MKVVCTDYFPEKYEGKTGVVLAIANPADAFDCPVGVRFDDHVDPIYWGVRELELLPAEDQPIPFEVADPIFAEIANDCAEAIQRFTLGGPWTDWMAPDVVNHPPHYTAHPSGVECIEITEHMNFCLGNALKYVWRAGLKGPNPVEDLQKAVFYIEREIARIEGDSE